ncbi:similar to Saccharomyces cerevisiae YNL211C Putative protein of unknown function [Maudiozyma barnettii]|uniref:Uncharacterized protein n=1 Tax=Maudiozyma barnettii TaxID=61262 RepID=A0A8H2ZHE7_9SACH|nr:Mrx7p [Kazachstania barnettii]CAB4253863.1 similar to Saccharomyces cerevisiae YNL211C Putative protein of unknown function [Kazachstania barnettii]CAD1781613.1 similar to Saccharomyces cerevisiae YNL211C Putative protein of unknown function [Kazachstania barnettii]
MKKAPRSIEEWLYFKLLDSPGFHRFVRRIYRRINGIKDTPDIEYRQTISPLLYKTTQLQKFKAFKILFIDEFRSSFGLHRKANDLINRR